MNRQEAIERLLDHYRNPRNRGPLEAADVVQAGGQPGCGDTITIYLKVDANAQQVAGLTFEGEGCTISQAAASLLTEKLQGAPLSDIDALDDQKMLDFLGREVVKTRVTCATLALNAVQRALANYRRQAQHTHTNDRNA